MFRVFVVVLALGMEVSLASAQAPTTEKPPEKPSAASAGATAPSAAKSRIMNNNDVRRDELTKKLEVRKQELHQCQHKDKAANSDRQRGEARKKD